MASNPIHARIKNKVNPSLGSILLDGEFAVLRADGKDMLKVGNGHSALSDIGYVEMPWDQISAWVEQAKSVVSVDGEKTDINVQHISQDDYAALVATSAVLSNTIYIVSGDHIEAYGQQMKNLAPASDLSDAVNLQQMSEAISAESSRMLSSTTLKHAVDASVSAAEGGMAIEDAWPSYLQVYSESISSLNESLCATISGFSRYFNDGIDDIYEEYYFPWLKPALYESDLSSNIIATYKAVVLKDECNVQMPWYNEESYSWETKPLFTVEAKYKSDESEEPYTTATMSFGADKTILSNSYYHTDIFPGEIELYYSTVYENSDYAFYQTDGVSMHGYDYNSNEVYVDLRLNGISYSSNSTQTTITYSTYNVYTHDYDSENEYSTSIDPYGLTCDTLTCQNEIVNNIQFESSTGYLWFYNDAEQTECSVTIQDIYAVVNSSGSSSVVSGENYVNAGESLFYITDGYFHTDFYSDGITIDNGVSRAEISADNIFMDFGNGGIITIGNNSGSPIIKAEYTDPMGEYTSWAALYEGTVEFSDHLYTEDYNHNPVYVYGDDFVRWATALPIDEGGSASQYEPTRLVLKDVEEQQFVSIDAPELSAVKTAYTASVSGDTLYLSACIAPSVGDLSNISTLQHINIDGTTYDLGGSIPDPIDPLSATLSGQYADALATKNALSAGIADMLSTELDHQFDAKIPYLIIEPEIFGTTSLSTQLQNYAINSISASSSTTQIVMIFPQKIIGKSRDFYVRLTLSSTTSIPTMIFQEQDGSSVSFDAGNDSWADIDTGINLLLFTETSQ